MKIFDCVTFFEEHLAMKIRFNVLDKFVDKFIICEGRQNHRGLDKKINFNSNDYPEFKNKIIHIICEEFPKNLNAWQRQAFQREKIFEGLNEARDHDLILFSDPDEIPNPKVFENIKMEKKYIIFLQRLFYYKLNLQDQDINSSWEGTRGCLKKNLKSIDYMRQKVRKKNLKYSFWRIDKEKNFDLVENGGWHFSYLLKPDDIQKKIKTFAHIEHDKKEYTDIENIKFCIDNSKDLFGRKTNFKKVLIDQSYPEYILKNIENFKDWII